MSFEELQIGAGSNVTDPPAIVGEIEAGRASKVRKQINKLISQSNSAQFDIAELLHESKTKNYYREWGYETFSEYAKSLDLKYSKSYYLVAIVSAMAAADIQREEYEPLGLAKLRIISGLNPEHEYDGIPGSMVIRELTKKAGQMTTEELKLEVEALKGYTGDESKVWLNISVTKSVLENVIRPAFEKIKKFLPQTEDEEGIHHDAGDGAALESICANFLTDPNFDGEPEPETEENALTPAGEPTVVPPPDTENEPETE